MIQYTYKEEMRRKVPMHSGMVLVTGSGTFITVESEKGRLALLNSRFNLFRMGGEVVTFRVGTPICTKEVLEAESEYYERVYKITIEDMFVKGEAEVKVTL